jgi:threonine dehydratase
MISLQSIQQAQKLLQPVVHHTLLKYSKTFSEMARNQVYLKLENIQKTGSFKVRGAYNKISSLTANEKSRGMIAASAGNHAQGVAYASSKLGTSSTIVMPERTPLSKIEATKKYGAKVILHGNMFDESLEYAWKLQQQAGYIFIHPFDDERIIEGQGTIGLEIMKQLPDADAIICPIGGGGLISGIALAAKAINPNLKIIGVESSACASMKASLQNQSIKKIISPGTIADGIAVKMPGKQTFDIAKQYVDEIVTVEDEEIARTMLLLLERSKLLVEGAGAASLSSLLYHRIGMKDKKIVCVISGGNIDMHFISRIIEHGLAEAGRYIRFFTVIADQPGQLNRLLELLAEQKANVISIAHNRMSPHVFPGLVEVDVSLETNNQEHIHKIEEILLQNGYEIKKEG